MAPFWRKNQFVSKKLFLKKKLRKRERRRKARFNLLQMRPN
jgi:hypothetical protein